MFYTMKDIFNVTNWYLETSLKYRSKLVRLSNGPLVSSSVELTHPDTAKVGLGSGMNNYVSSRCGCHYHFTLE